MAISGVGAQKSFANLQTEFGGSHPITMGEYAAYRVSGSGNTIDMDDFAGASANTATITSGYIHHIGSGPRGGTRIQFSKGYASPAPSPSVSAPASGSISGSNIVVSGTALGVITSLGHYTVGPAGGIYIVLSVYNLSSGATSNAGFTNMVLTKTNTSATVTLARTSAYSFNYSSSTSKRTWTWYYHPTTSGYSDTTSGSVSVSGFTSKLFGDASTGSGTDANPRTTAVFS